ncbi:hypothetical protein IQ07DRAFT_507863, partial [Pyrenochaeta sp. DS3sAY3a]
TLSTLIPHYTAYTIYSHKQNTLPKSTSPIYTLHLSNTPKIKMNNADLHPRVLSLSADSSAAATPTDQSRRASHESEHAATTHFASQQDKTHKTLNQSIKKMWKDIKHAAVEHHRGVNAAYQASYGYGTGAYRVGGK